jgi:UPF0755 protein
VKRPGYVPRWVALAALALFAAVLAIGFTYFDRSLPKAQTTVIIPSGSSASDVASILARDGVIANAFAFRLLARVSGLAPQVKAGEFRFAPHRTQGEILHQVTTQGAQTAVWVTLPEGFTAREMATAIADRGVSNAPALEREFLSGSLDLYGARTPSLEGYLFPSTYLVPRDAAPADIAKILTDQFRRELPADAAARAKVLGLTVPQVVTLASLIEREAKADDERPLMAGVYYNRLRKGMPLEVDATIEYIFPEHKTVITRADLAIDSPYNTYRNAGLPPTPIANPGKPSLEAAFHPKPSDYLFYVYKGDGHHAFSRTLAEHEANVARYLR